MPLERPSTRRLWLTDDDLAPALLFVVLGALALLTPVQNDTFWHLRSGQEMWQSGALLTSEPFSHTSSGSPLHNHWWLSQLAFFAVYSLGGSFLLTAFAGACCLLAVALSWRLVRGGPEIRVVLLLWMLLLVLAGWAIRPQAISFVFMALVAHLVVANRLAWLPLVCMVWANTHALVVLGIAVSAALVLEALVWSRSELRRSVTVWAACAAAPLLSPLGLNYWPQAVTTVTWSKTLELAEYRLPLAPGDLPFWMAIAALIVLAVVRRRTLVRLPRAERALVVGAMILACAGMSAARNIPVFALLAVPALSWLWGDAPAAGRRRAPRAASLGAYACLAASLLVAAAVVTWQWRGSEWQGSRGAGDWRPLSTPLIRAVSTCPEPTFNRFDDGGYLMWKLPDRKVFVDSRIEAYSADVLRRSRAADMDGEYVDTFGRYGINCAVVSTDSALYTRLRRDTSFELTYSDARRSVFVRRQAMASRVN